MRWFWTAYFILMSLVFGFAFVNSVTSTYRGKSGVVLGLFALLILMLDAVAFKWWRASIAIGPDGIVLKKLLVTIHVPLDGCDRFDFVQGRFGFYTYVGAMSGETVVARSSYGPIQNILGVRKSARMNRFLGTLNEALGEAKGV